MSKDMLGPVIRAAVGVPQNRLEVLAKIASAMAADSPVGNDWHEQLKKLLKEGLALPIDFERNENGHIVFTIIGLDITGAEEIKRIEASGYRIGDWARSCLTSTKADGYDKNHRLVAEKEYKIVLIPGKEIAKDSDRTTKDLQKLAEKYGYDKPLAGIVPRVRESISDKQMEEMGIWYIVALHDPIIGSDGDPGVLSSVRSDDGLWLSGYWDDPDDEWGDGGAFAFLVPAS